MSLKKSVKNLLLNIQDKYKHKRSRFGEIEKFRDKRRVAIYSQVNLTKEQIAQIDEVYLKNYGEKIPYIWHRHFTAFTGNFDPYYFPELLFIPEFERYMNETKESAYVQCFEDKNIIPLLANAANIVMPHAFFSNAAGFVCDDDHRKTTIKKIETISGDYFIKPTVDSCSGQGCQIVSLNKGIDEITGSTITEILNSKGNHWVIQEIVKCHSSIANIYKNSVNTFKIMTYLWKGNIQHAPIIMRIGQGGSYLDNVHAGGMFIALEDDGTMHGTAFTEFKNEFTEHPDTHFKFEGYKMSLLPDVIKAAEKCHSFIPQVGCINWDFTINQQGVPLLIEANMRGGSVWLFEMAHGKGVFGELTPEILQWLKVMNHTKKTERSCAF